MIHHLYTSATRNFCPFNESSLQAGLRVHHVFVSANGSCPERGSANPRVSYFDELGRVKSETKCKGQFVDTPILMGQTHTVDGRKHAPPKTPWNPWNDNFLASTNKPLFHPQYGGSQNSDSLTIVGFLLVLFHSNHSLNAACFWDSGSSKPQPTPEASTVKLSDQKASHKENCTSQADS